MADARGHRLAQRSGDGVNKIEVGPQRLLVLGGAGKVGRSLVRELSRRGHRCLVTARTEEDRVSFLRCTENSDDIDCRVFEFGESEANRFVEEVANLFAPDHVVLSFSQSTSEIEMLELPMDDFDRCLRDQLRSQLVVARALLPQLSGRGLFLMLNGSTALRAEAARGLTHIPAAAALMLQRVLAAEHPQGPRIWSLLLQGAVAVDDLPPEHQITAEALVRAVVFLVGHADATHTVFGLSPQRGLRALLLSVDEAPDLEELA